MTTRTVQKPVKLIPPAERIWLDSLKPVYVPGPARGLHTFGPPRKDRKALHPHEAQQEGDET